jgi:hypothetical protein
LEQVTKPMFPKPPAQARAKPPGRSATKSTPAKEPAGARPKLPPKSPAKPAAPRARPSLRFYHSESLRAKSLAVLDTLEEAEDPTKHRDALADLVVELTESGMDYFFIRPLKDAKAGFITEQSASLGMAGSLRVMATVLRNIIGRMNEPQLLSICSSIRQLMR